MVSLERALSKSPDLLHPSNQAPSLTSSTLTTKQWTPLTHSQAAHLLSTTSIANRRFENEELEGAHPSQLFPKIKELIEEAVKLGAPQPSPAFDKAMTQVLEVCEAAKKWNSTKDPIEKQAAEFADMMITRLKALPIGENYTISGGWKGRKTPGHSMLYKFGRTGEDTFTFTIYNSGAGLEYHPSKIKEGGKIRYVLSLPFNNIPLASVTNIDFWSAHFQILFGKNMGKDFDAKTLYEGLFPVLIPNFNARFGGDQDLSKARYLREQTAGVCTAQSLLTLLRESVGDDYHQLRDKVRSCVLKHHGQILESQNHFGSYTYSHVVLKSQKGSLQFLEREVQRLAGDIHRDTIKRRHKFEDPKHLALITKNFSTVKKVAQRIADAHKVIKDQCERMSAFSWDAFTPLRQDLFCLNPSFSAIPEIPQDPIPLSGEKLILEDPIWPTRSEEALTALYLWITRIKTAFQEGAKADHGIYIWIQEIFKCMPSYHAKLWKALPEKMQMPCMENLSILCNFLVRTHLTQTNRVVWQCTVEACLIKVNAVILSLARKQPHSISMMIPFGYSTYHEPYPIKLPWRKNAGFFLSDPKLNHEAIDAISFLSSCYKDFSEWFDKIDRLFDGYTSSSYEASNETVKDTAIDYSLTEFSWMNSYLLLPENAATFKKIQQALSQEGKLTGQFHKDFPVIVAEAVANAKLYFPESPFSIIQQQAFLQRIAKKTPTFDWIRSLQHGSARHEALFQIRLDSKALPKAKLLLSLCENPQKPLLTSLPTHHPTPYLKEALEGVCDEWEDSSYSNTKKLLLRQGLSNKLENAPEEFQKLVSFQWKEDPQHAAMKVISYYRQHIALLKETDHHWILKSCLFAPGTLQSQLAHPCFADSLKDFIQFGYFQAKSDIPTAVFFLHIGDKLQRYCPPTGISAEFPTISQFKILQNLEEQILKNEALPIKKQIHQALLSAVVLANYGNGEQLWQKDCEELLFHAFRFAAYRFLDTNSIPLDLVEEASFGLLKLLKFIKEHHQQSSDFSDQILSRAVSRFTNKTKVINYKWEGFNDSFPIIHTPKREYQIDLLSGQLWVGTSQACMIPHEIIKNPLFCKLFPNINELSEISSTPSLTLFRDKHGVQHKAWIDSNEDLHLARNIDDVWHTYTETDAFNLMISKTLNDQCTRWAEKTSQVLSDCEMLINSLLQTHFLSGKEESAASPKSSEKDISPLRTSTNLRFVDRQTGKIRYFYDRQKASLEWLHGNPSQKRLYAVKQGSTEMESFFAKFDPHPQLWRDETGNIVVIELPNYRLRFDVIYLAPKPIITCREFPGYRLAKYQYLPQLLQSSGYLILAKISEDNYYVSEENLERLVLIPKMNFECFPDFTMFLIQNWTSFDYFVYHLNFKGELTQTTHLEARLYLAYLYTMLGEYQRAEKLLYLPHESVSLGPYSSEALTWLKAIAEGKGSQKILHKSIDLSSSFVSQDLRLSAARLQAFILRKENLEEWESPQPERGLEKEIETCILSQSRLPPEIVRNLKSTFPKQLLCVEDHSQSPKNLKEWLWKTRDQNWGTDSVSSVLDTPFVLEPESQEMRRDFFSLYSIAYSRNIDLAKKRERLYQRMQMIHGKQRLFATILLGCLTATHSELSEKWMAPSALLQVLQSFETSTKKPILNAFEKLLELALANQKRFQQTWIKESNAFKISQKECEVKTHSEYIPTLKKNIPITLARSKILEDLMTAIQHVQRSFNIKNLKNVLEDVSIKLYQLDPKLNVLRKKMLELAKKLPLDPLLRMSRESELLSGKAEALNFSKLLLCYLKADASFYHQQNPALTEADILQLHALTEEFLLNATWKQQLKRTQDLMFQLENIPLGRSGSKNHELLVQKLLNTIHATRQYHPHQHPEYLLFEYSCNLLLYKEQVAQIETLIDHKQWTILEILMGSGKTEILLPLIAFKKADHKAIPVIVLPETLIKNFASTIQQRLGRIFSQNLIRINWSGTDKGGMTLAELERIRRRLESIPEQGACLIVSQMDMHRLVLQIKRAKIELARTAKAEALRKWEVYQAILNLMESRGQWLIDEVDLCLRPDFEMHQALDAGSSIDPTRTAISQLLYTTLLQKFSDVSFDFSPQPGKQPCTPELYYQKMQNPLSNALIEQLLSGKALIKDYGKELSQFAQEIQAFRAPLEIYLKNPQADLPLELKAETKDLFAFLRFQLHTLLPLTLHKLHGQNYGRFPEKDGCQSPLAGPYHLKDTPCLGSQFGLSGEQINYTFEAYLKEGVTLQDVQKEIIRLQNEFQQTLALQGSSFITPQAVKEFRSLFDPKEEYSLMQIQPGHLHEIVKKLSADKPRLLQFVRLILDRTLRTPKQQITSTPQQILNLCASAKGISGTVNPKMFPKQFKEIQIVRGIQNKEKECIKRNRKIHTISSQCFGTDFLDALLKNDSQHKIKAIIDVGALLTGASMSTLALHLLQRRPTLEAVIYYEKDIAWILKRDHAPIPYNADLDKEIDPANRFTIYDQKRCTGANIAQDPEAEAFVTLHKTQTFRDLAQGVWRMREIEKGQQVHLVVTDEIRTIIASTLGKNPLDLETNDLIDYSLRTQAQLQTRNGVKLIKQQLRALFEETCEALLKKAAPHLWHAEPYKSLILLSITELQDKPYQQYGKPVEEASALKVLTAYGENLLEAISHWNSKYAHLAQFGYLKLNIAVSSELAKAKNQVRLIVEGALKEGIIPQKLLTQQGTETEQEVMTEIEQEKELQVEQQQEYDRSKLKVNQDLTWPKISQLCVNGDFMNTPLTEAESKELRNAKHEISTVRFWSYWTSDWNLSHNARPPTLNANDALKMRPIAYQLLQQSNPFSPDLIVSANLLYLEEGGEAFGPIQIPRTRCLINQGPTKVQILLLEPQDSEEVLKEIGSKAENNHAFALYDYTLGPRKAGMYATSSKSKGVISWDTLSSRRNFQELFVQYKFFCGELDGYSPEEFGALKSWLGRHKGKLGELETVFKQVILTPSKRGAYQKSLVALCFKAFER